jgi:hypothetical protein
VPRRAALLQEVPGARGVQLSDRLGHTSVRMADQVYVGLYDEAGRDVANAIDELVRFSRGAGVGQR